MDSDLGKVTKSREESRGKCGFHTEKKHEDDAGSGPGGAKDVLPIFPSFLPSFLFSLSLFIFFLNSLTYCSQL